MKMAPYRKILNTDPLIFFCSVLESGVIPTYEKANITLNAKHDIYVSVRLKWYFNIQTISANIILRDVFDN